jgi:flagellar biosynthetic protein FlhB
MSDHKTEQPTPRRRNKAREQGQVARSRELSSAFAIAGTLALLKWRSVIAVHDWQTDMKTWLSNASSANLQVQALVLHSAASVLMWAAPIVLAAWVLALSSSFAQGGLNWAPSALGFRLERISPASRIKQLFSVQAVSGLLRSLVPTIVIVYLAIGVLTREWDHIRSATFGSDSTLMAWLFGLLFELAWKSALVMLVWSAADYLLVRYQVESGLKMSREEVRQEHKETEGDPQVKGRIRRLQRQVRRRKMLQDVSRAAVVVTNPTHYAIALEYTAEMPAPVLVAKGRDRLAQQIKEQARWHEVPMVENPPLAHALYRAVQLGHSIPSKLYVAVAEVLAYVLRAQALARKPVEVKP